MAAGRKRDRKAEDIFTHGIKNSYGGIVANPLALGESQRWGDVGRSSRKFLRRLSALGVAFWRISEHPPETLPSGEKAAHSQGLWSSALAPNPLYVDGLDLYEWGLWTAEERDFFETYAESDWPSYAAVKDYLLRRAARQFSHRASGELMAEFLSFAKTEKEWLEPYGLFQSLHRALGKCPWQDWPEALKWKSKRAMDAAKRQLSEALQVERLLQFFFYRQWNSLRTLAKNLGISLIPSLPLWLDESMADLWLEPKFFSLDAQGHPNIRVIPQGSGEWRLKSFPVHPAYRWQRMAEDHYAWWGRRVQTLGRHCDALYISDFPELLRHAEIPLTAEGNIEKDIGNAEGDICTVAGPGVAFFQVLQFRSGHRLCIADPKVEALSSSAEWASLQDVLSSFWCEWDAEPPTAAGDEKIPDTFRWVQLLRPVGQERPDSRRSIARIFRKCEPWGKAFRSALNLGKLRLLRRWKKWRQKQILGLPLYLRLQRLRQTPSQLVLHLRTWARKISERDKDN
ncbi:MAG: 4-alpha-glucanotransferase [Puniceicoccales bacterium]|jgi:hypothetical protein|nr:4-alpha-glucanotransferase [Puniceicoccales bacterium]